LILFILTLALQAALIAHVIKTGRNGLWIVAIALMPPLGLLYIAMEILPDLVRGAPARRAASRMQKVLDPDRGLRRASAEVEISGNVDSRLRLGEELLGRRQFAEAIEVYQGGLTGIFEHDPALLLGLARAQFMQDDFAAARASLERLIKNNPDFRSSEGHLLYARTLDAEGALEEAEQEYAAVAQGYPGAEARLRYGLLLKRRGKIEAARAVFKDLLDGAKLGPAHYRRAQAEWLERARRELS
jgi:hypothetical protein